MFKIVFRLIGVLSLVLSLFFVLINNINYFTSNLSKERRQLNSQKQILEADLERRRSQARSDLTTTIEDRVKNGSIELIPPGGTVSTTELKPSIIDTIKETPQEVQAENTTQGSGVTIR
jgi:hypothetical protein